MNKVVQYGVMNVRRGTDTSTLVLAYGDPNMLPRLEALVAGYKRRNSQSFVDKFSQIDIFIDLNCLSHPKVGDPPSWKRIIYECLLDNPDPFRRWPDAMIALVGKGSGGMTLNKLLNGGVDR